MKTIDVIPFFENFLVVVSKFDRSFVYKLSSYVEKTWVSSSYVEKKLDFEMVGRWQGIFCHEIFLEFVFKGSNFL